ncbi:MAG: response regulator [Proteobacteria bacterium]|nr:response regulator [Pseudomonadota bacterium]
MTTTKILLVDDINISIEMGKIALSSSGAKVLTACNGCEALEIVKKEMPDIVLCDVYMPEMNGDELCKTIKEDPSLKNIPVILFSSYSDDKDTRAKYFRSGCDDVLVKPYQRQELINTIRKYVNISTREHKRKLVDIEADCHIIEVDHNAIKKMVPGKVVDMSIGGMMLESEKSFPLDTYIELTVFINGDGSGIPVKGKVVWSDKQKMGIQFLFIPTHIKNFLVEAA